ncbi:MAG: ADP-glyceromanno-heptose 6-epimerase [Bacteroidia bacterium]
MIVITGAEGFIGSCLVARLNEEGYNDLVLVDDFSSGQRARNLEGKKFSHKVERKVFFEWLDRNENQVQFIFHIGARTDTTESDEKVLKELNLDFTRSIWNSCVKYGLPLVYASSAATYGEGELGYDDQKPTGNLHPLNAYGRSKNDFDNWALSQPKHPYFWVGLKFFNVYGPNEYHKGRMASVVLHAFHQVMETGKVKLFRSHRKGFRDGEQKRDFIYVKDVADVCLFFMHHRKNSGIYNLGTGKAATFLELVNAIFSSTEKKTDIEFIDTPEDIREKYQYFTEAKMEKLRGIGYTKSFSTVEEGVKDYIQQYLIHEKYR